MSFLLKFTIILFVVMFAFAYLTRNYRNNYKLYMVFGKKGSGKSTFLTSQAVKYIKKGWVVYTNMLDCAVNGVRLINVKDIGDFVPESNSLLLIDEVGMIWDNRDFKNFRPAVRDFFKLQRHYKVVCILASQTWDIDKKLRDLTDGMFLFVNVFNVFSVGKRIVRKIVLTESTSEAESRISENLKFAPIWNWKFLFIPAWKQYYNSFDVPDMPKINYEVIESGVNPLEKKPSILEKIKHMKLFAKFATVDDAIEFVEIKTDEMRTDFNYKMWLLASGVDINDLTDDECVTWYDLYTSSCDFVSDHEAESECSETGAILDSSHT